MTIKDIVDFVKDRSGEQDPATLIREVRNEYRRLWYSEDVDGCLQEIDFNPDSNRVITLPWYVHQIKACRRLTSTPQRLMTPRSYFHDFNWRQHVDTFRVLSRQPLFKSLVNVGPLTFKLRAANEEAFTVTVRGPDDMGVSNIETISFAPNDTEKTTTGSYVDVKTLGKSIITAVDVEVYDVNDELVSVIPASQTEVLCVTMQIVDKAIMPYSTNCNVFTALFKSHMPPITSLSDVVQEEVGLVLQAKVAAARLGIRLTKESSDLAEKYSSQGSKLRIATAENEDNGKDRILDLRPSPWTSAYSGLL